MFCPNCGKLVNDTAKFCSACGKPVNEAVDNPIENSEVEKAQEIPSENTVVTADVQTAVADVADVADIPAAANAQPHESSNNQTPNINEKPVATNPIKNADVAPEKKGDGFLKGFLATVYCVLIFMFLIIGTTLLTARFAVSSDNLKSVTTKVEWSMVDSLLTDNNLINSSNAETNLEILEEVFTDSSIPEFASEKISAYGDYLLGGNKPEKVTNKEVTSLLVNNRNITRMIFTPQALDNPKESESALYKRYYTEVLKPGLDSAIYENKKVDKFMDISRIVLSIWVLIALALLLSLLIFALVKVKIKKGKFLSWLGWTFTVSGALYLIIFAAASICNLFITIWGEGVKGLIGIVLGSIALDVVITGGIILLLGIIMIVIKKLISKKAKVA